MVKYTDPIFTHLSGLLCQHLITDPSSINKSLHNGAKIKSKWADGFDFSELSNLHKTQTVLITNSIFDVTPALEPYVQIVNPSYYGIMYYNYQVDAYTPTTHDFNCFMNRYDIFRQSWLYQLIRRDYFDKGHISFNCEENPDRLPDDYNLKGMTPSQIFEYGFQQYHQIFEKEHNQIKDRIPFRTFKESNDLTNLILTSKFSLILETWFHDNRVITFSEKTMRGLQLPRPWVLFSTQYAIKQLRNWGFDVLDDIVDHSYDNIADSVLRQVCILDQMKLLASLDIELIVARCIQASNHNQSILKMWHDVFATNIDKDFELACQKALAL